MSPYNKTQIAAMLTYFLVWCVMMTFGWPDAKTTYLFGFLVPWVWFCFGKYIFEIRRSR